LTVLSVKDLRIPYSKKGTLPSISFELEASSLLFITGANGMGKSTFLKQLSGSIASQRSIMLHHKTLEDYTLREKALQIGFLEQRHSITFPLLVKDLVVMGLYIHKATLEPYSAKDYERVWNVLHELGIDYLFEKNILSLSGGEQQLCFLAQLSLQDPALMLLDEPTQQLDLYNKEKVFQWMEKQVVEKKKTLICVTHDLHWINATRGFILNLNTQNNSMQTVSKPIVNKVIEHLKHNED
jgi:iron complex transport system ATP-binding protein